RFEALDSCRCAGKRGDTASIVTDPAIRPDLHHDKAPSRGKPAPRGTRLVHQPVKKPLIRSKSDWFESCCWPLYRARTNRLPGALGGWSNNSINKSIARSERGTLIR